MKIGAAGNRTELGAVGPTTMTIGASHYRFSSYMTPERWQSVYHQLREVLECGGNSVLEIGKGDGTLGALLTHYGLAYASIDLDQTLRPDLVGSVTQLPIKSNAVDVVCCFQVLEHLPFDQFRSAVCELARVSAANLIISLPDARRIWEFSAHRSKRRTRRLRISIPRLGPHEHRFDGQHYWEIGARGYSLTVIRREMEASGLELLRTFRAPANPYHRFFVAKKARSGSSSK